MSEERPFTITYHLDYLGSNDRWVRSVTFYSAEAALERLAILREANRFEWRLVKHEQRQTRIR